MKFSILLLLVVAVVVVVCDSNIKNVDSISIDIPPPNDSTVVFITSDDTFGFHVAAYYSHSIINLTSGIFDTDVCWTPDKKNIFYTSFNREHNFFQIWKMKYDGSDKQPVTPTNISCTSPQVSPNGEFLVFTAKNDNISQIIITDTLGNNWHQLTNSKMIPGIRSASFYLPSWAPDGVSVIFNYYDNIPDQYNPPHVAMMNILSNEITFFTKIDTMYPHHARISPKFNELIFVGNAIPGDQIYRINIDQTNLVKLSDSFIAGFPDWSSDGERIIFVQKMNSIEEPDAIWVMNRDGSEKRKLISREGYLCSMPDW